MSSIKVLDFMKHETDLPKQNQSTSRPTVTWNTERLSLILIRYSWQNKMTCAPCEDSDQTGHRHPPSLTRVFALRMKKAWVLSYPMSAQWRLWSDWAAAKADLSLRWAHSHFVGFDMLRLKLLKSCSCLFFDTDRVLEIGQSDRSDQIVIKKKKMPCK